MKGNKRKKNFFFLEMFYDLCFVFKLLRNFLFYLIIVKWYFFILKSNLNMFLILF